jgi:hypothetical protein
VIGAVFGSTTGLGFHDAPLLLGASLGSLAGATNGVLMTGAILGAEIFLPRTRLGHALERVPFLVTFAMKLLVYGTMIVLVIGVRPGWHLVGAIATNLSSPELTAAISMQINAPRTPSMVRGFSAVGFGVLLLQMGRLVGEQTLRDIVFGRYHRSRTSQQRFRHPAPFIGFDRDRAFYPTILIVIASYDARSREQQPARQRRPIPWATPKGTRWCSKYVWRARPVGPTRGATVAGSEADDPSRLGKQRTALRGRGHARRSEGFDAGGRASRSGLGARSLIEGGAEMRLLFKPLPGGSLERHFALVPRDSPDPPSPP